MDFRPALDDDSHGRAVRAGADSCAAPAGRPTRRPDPVHGFQMPSFDHLTMSTGRLRLRPLRHADVPALMAIYCDAAVMRYWSTPAWAREEDAHAMLEEDLAAMASGDYVQLGVERLADGALAGTCTLFDFNVQCRRAEVGYALGRAFWGSGYMHEALVALLDYGFSSLDLHRVEADVDPRNTASAKTLERLGFVREGLLRERWIVAGEVSDTAFYGLLRSDWRFAP